MTFGPCLCGDPLCASCGPAQGTPSCLRCGRLTFGDWCGCEAAEDEPCGEHGEFCSAACFALGPLSAEEHARTIEAQKREDEDQDFQRWRAAEEEFDDGEPENFVPSY